MVEGDVDILHIAQQVIDRKMISTGHESSINKNFKNANEQRRVMKPVLGQLEGFQRSQGSWNGFKEIMEVFEEGQVEKPIEEIHMMYSMEYGGSQEYVKLLEEEPKEGEPTNNYKYQLMFRETGLFQLLAREPWRNIECNNFRR